MGERIRFGGRIFACTLLLLGILFSAVLTLMRGEIGIWVALSDALLTSGSLFLGAAALLWVRQMGGLDGIVYLLRAALRALVPFARRSEVLRYGSGMVDKGCVGAARVLLLVGILFFVPAVILGVALG